MGLIIVFILFNSFSMYIRKRSLLSGQENHVVILYKFHLVIPVGYTGSKSALAVISVLSAAEVMVYRPREAPGGVRKVNQGTGEHPGYIGILFVVTKS